MRRKDLKLKKIANSIIASANPDKIILFGSRASGKQKRESDYDILVLKKYLKNSNILSKKIYLNLKIPVSVDILVTTPSRYNKLKDKWFFVYYDIHKSGQVIYEKQ